MWYETYTYYVPAWHVAVLKLLAITPVHISVGKSCNREYGFTKVSVARKANKNCCKQTTFLIITAACKRSRPVELLVKPGVHCTCVNFCSMPLKRNTYG
jgi:hypothetical protein